MMIDTIKYVSIIFLCSLLSLSAKENDVYNFKQVSKIYVATLYDLDKKERLVKWHKVPDGVANQIITDLKGKKFKEIRAASAFAGFCYAILSDKNDKAICALYIPYLSRSKDPVASVYKITKTRGKYIIGDRIGGKITFKNLERIRTYAIKLDQKQGMGSGMGSGRDLLHGDNVR